MTAMRHLHAIVKERQAGWHRDAADERRLAQARSGDGDRTVSSSQPDPAARRFALLFHALRRGDSGAVRP
jgi:hypothetical protein